MQKYKQLIRLSLVLHFETYVTCPISDVWHMFILLFLNYEYYYDYIL